MFPKMLIAIVFITVIAAALLSLRQQRLETMHEITRLQLQMDDARRETWDTQVRIAELAQPDVLREKLRRAQLELEPVVHPNLLDPPLGPGIADTARGH